MSEPKPEYDKESDDYHELIGRWWAMRQYAIDIGLIAEAELIEAGVLTEKGRRFFNRADWRELTNVSQ